MNDSHVTAQKTAAVRRDAQPLSIDIFCRVIDNYGDLGVCFRLARQLASENGARVRLIADDFSPFSTLARSAVVSSSPARVGEIELLRWINLDTVCQADVVIEAFACDPPAAYVASMAARSVAPVWLNLEYLSAEPWVDGVHGLPSPHPRLPLTKYFFCPGFSAKSGGLIREAALALDASVATNFPPNPGALRVFSFTYPDAPVARLIRGCERAGWQAEVSVAAPLKGMNDAWVTTSPVAQMEFDRLLARFDLLLVRGEDSFVRAQYAAKPMLWHIYPTPDDAHLTKLDAWLDRYCEGLEPHLAAIYRAASHAFVRPSPTAESEDEALRAFEAFARELPALAQHAAQWRKTLFEREDLASQLLGFIDTVRAKTRAHASVPTKK